MNPNFLLNGPPLYPHYNDGLLPTPIPITPVLNGNVQKPLVDSISYFYPQMVNTSTKTFSFPTPPPPLPPGCDSFPLSYVPLPLPNPTPGPSSVIDYFHGKSLPPKTDAVQVQPANISYPPPNIPPPVIQNIDVPSVALAKSSSSCTGSSSPDCKSERSSVPELSHTEPAANVPDGEKEKPSKLARVYTGFVTFRSDDLGFVGEDREIFFHSSILQKGVEIKQGDYVLIKAEVVEGVPLFKWVTKEIQVVDPQLKIDMTFVPIETTEAKGPAPKVPPPAPVISAQPHPVKANDHSKPPAHRNRKRSSSRSRSYSRERPKRKKFAGKWARKKKAYRGYRSRSSEERSRNKKDEKLKGNASSLAKTSSSSSRSPKKTISSEKSQGKEKDSDVSSKERKRLTLKKFSSPSRSPRKRPSSTNPANKNGGHSFDRQSRDKCPQSHYESKSDCRSLRDQFEALRKKLPEQSKEGKEKYTRTPASSKNGKSQSGNYLRCNSGRSESRSYSPLNGSHSNKGTKPIIKSVVSLVQKDTKKAPIPIVIKTQNLSESKDKEKSNKSPPTKVNSQKLVKSVGKNTDIANCDQELRRIYNEICTPTQMRSFEEALAIINKPMPVIASPVISLAKSPIPDDLEPIIPVTEPAIKNSDDISKEKTQEVIKPIPKLDSIFKTEEPVLVAFKKFNTGIPKKTITSPKPPPTIQKVDNPEKPTDSEKPEEIVQTPEDSNSDIPDIFQESVNSANRWKERALKKELGQLSLKNSLSALTVPLQARLKEFQSKYSRSPAQLASPKILKNDTHPDVSKVVKKPKKNTSEPNMEESQSQSEEPAVKNENLKNNVKNLVQSEKVRKIHTKETRNGQSSPVICTVLVHDSLSSDSDQTETIIDDRKKKKKKSKKHSRDDSARRTKKSRKESKTSINEDSDDGESSRKRSRESDSPSSPRSRRPSSKEESESEWVEDGVPEGYDREYKGWFNHDSGRVFLKDPSPDRGPVLYRLGRPPFCRACGLVGHYTRDCWHVEFPPRAPPRRYNYNYRLPCSICGAKEHLESMCPENQGVYKRSF